MKTSVTLTFESQTLENVKKNVVGKSLSSFTNDLYNQWLENKKREKLIEAYKSLSKSKIYKETAELTDRAIGDWENLHE